MWFDLEKSQTSLSSLSDNKYIDINRWLDIEFGLFSYFDIRDISVSAMNNTLKNDYPKFPFTARELLLWAERNNEESFFITPAYQAIQGQSWWHDFDGTPKVNPLTMKKNSDSDMRGLAGNVDKVVFDSLSETGEFIGDWWNDAQLLAEKYATYASIVITVAGVGYVILNPLAEQFAKNLFKGGKK